MPVDVEKIKQAFSDFENDDFVAAKDIIKKEIGAAKDEFIQSKLGLQKDVKKEDGEGEDKDKE